MIREGMMVEVMHGPLKGVIGRLMRKGAHARLVLSVDLIGQAVSVEVDAADVQRVLMKIGSVQLAYPFVVAPMAGMTDSAFRRLVKRQGGCGLVVTEMVSSEGLVRGIDRTLEYAEYTEEERPVSIQIFGGDPEKMAAAAQIVEGLGADIVDVNMGCPVPKIAKHNAGCSLMREPEHAATVINAMAKAVKIPVTVKMRAGWNDRSRNAAELARRVQDAGAAAVTIHGRTAEQSYSGSADWDLVSGVARDLAIPVMGSGDCVEPGQIVERLALRREWRARRARRVAQPVDPRAGRGPGGGRAPRDVTLSERGQFLLDYVDLLVNERVDESVGFRHLVVDGPRREAKGRERWVINKVRALCAWYSKGSTRGPTCASESTARRPSRSSAKSSKNFSGSVLLQPFPACQASVCAGESANHIHFSNELRIASLRNRRRRRVRFMALS